MAFKVPPFQDCILSFLGFSEEEKNNMEERTLKHGTEESSLNLIRQLLLTNCSAMFCSVGLVELCTLCCQMLCRAVYDETKTNILQHFTSVCFVHHDLLGLSC